MTRHIAIITLPGFNEIDSFVAARMIGSVPGLTVELVGPDRTATSMAGITVETAGGCLSSTYLAYWIIDQLADREQADAALGKVVPIGEATDYQNRVEQLIPPRDRISQ